MGAVFAKTERGHAELNKRSGLLTSKARRALIFVDGKRTVAELEALLQSEDLRRTLGQLEEDGFIEYLELNPPVAVPPAPASPVAPPEPAVVARQTPVSAAHFSPLPDADAHAKRLRMARNIMHEGISSFIGPRGAAPLVQQIADAKTLGELRALYDPWLFVMVTSMASEWEEHDLRERLLRVI